MDSTPETNASEINAHEEPVVQHRTQGCSFCRSAFESLG
jgi:hypothetical protein